MEKLLHTQILDSFWFRLLDKWLVMGAMLFWLAADAKSRNVEPTGYFVGTFLLAPVAIPVYLVRTRGWRAFGVWLLRFLGCIVMLVFTVKIVLDSLKVIGISNA